MASPAAICRLPPRNVTFHAQNSSSRPLEKEKEEERPLPRPREPACARVDRFGLDMCKYDAHEEMVARLRALEVEHPGLARTGIIGKTVEGSDIFYIKVR